MANGAPTNGRKWLLNVMLSLLGLLLTSILIPVVVDYIHVHDRVLSLEIWKGSVDKFHEGERFTREEGKAMEGRVRALEQELARLQR